MAAAEKEFIQANDLVRDAFALARKIYDSSFLPEVLLVIWRGGTPVGIVIHEFLLYKGVTTYHTVVKGASYEGIERRTDPVIENIDSVVDKLKPNCRVLVIDDIFDTGRTLETVRAHLARKTRSVKTATLYCRIGRREGVGLPDFYLRETDRWIVFPHELVGLSPEEIRCKDPRLHRLLSA